MWDAACYSLAFWLEAHNTIASIEALQQWHALMLVQQPVSECGLGLSQPIIQCCIKTIPATFGEVDFGWST